MGSEWHLQAVTVTHPTTGQQLVFPFSGWIGASTGLEHLLYPEGSEDAVQNLMVEYEVLVDTSDVKGAGTDAEVLLAMEGEHGVVGSQRLKAASKDPFERNQSDRCVLTGKNIGKINQVWSLLWGAGAGTPGHHPCLCFVLFGIRSHRSENPATRARQQSGKRLALPADHRQNGRRRPHLELAPAPNLDHKPRHGRSRHFSAQGLGEARPNHPDKLSRRSRRPRRSVPRLNFHLKSSGFWD